MGDIFGYILSTMIISLGVYAIYKIHIRHTCYHPEESLERIDNGFGPSYLAKHKCHKCGGIIYPMMDL